MATKQPKAARIPWDQWKSPEEREKRRQRRDLVRNYYAQEIIVAPTTPEEAFRAVAFWLMPWKRGRYPGIHRGLRQLCGLLNDRAAADAIRRGHARREVVERMARAIEAKVAAGAAIAAALRRGLAERPAPKPRGLQIIGDDGLRKHQARRGRAKPAGARRGDRPV